MRNPMNGEATAQYIQGLTEEIKKLLEDRELLPTQ